MVFSDDFLHFLKIKKKTGRIQQNYLVALMLIMLEFSQHAEIIHS